MVRIRTFNLPMPAKHDVYARYSVVLTYITQDFAHRVLFNAMLTVKKSPVMAALISDQLPFTKF